MLQNEERQAGLKPALVGHEDCQFSVLLDNLQHLFYNLLLTLFFVFRLFVETVQ